MGQRTAEIGTTLSNEERQLVDRAVALTKHKKLARYVRDRLLECAREDLAAAGLPIDKPPENPPIRQRDFDRLIDRLREDLLIQAREEFSRVAREHLRAVERKNNPSSGSAEDSA